MRIGEWRWALGASALVVALASVPYLVCWAIVPAGSHYTGLLINPIDGHSYLAKMGQGAAGSWLVRLPYTAETHEPALVYTYLLALGHLVPSGSPTSLSCRLPPGARLLWSSTDARRLWRLFPYVVRHWIPSICFAIDRPLVRTGLVGGRWP